MSKVPLVIFEAARLGISAADKVVPAVMWPVVVTVTLV